MFNVNDYVMYGTTGVCQVKEIKKDKFIGDVETEYYILHSIFGNKVRIMTPVNNQKIMMRRLTPRNEIDDLIAKTPSLDTPWINDDNQRNKQFKEALNTGKCEEWIKIIKEIHLKEKEQSEAGKKLHQSDENVIKSAERLLFEEFSTSLQIPIEEVEDYILSRIPG